VAELTVADLTGVRSIKDEIEIAWEADRSTSPSESRTP